MVPEEEVGACLEGESVAPQFVDDDVPGATLPMAVDGVEVEPGSSVEVERTPLSERYLVVDAEEQRVEHVLVGVEDRVFGHGLDVNAVEVAVAQVAEFGEEGPLGMRTEGVADAQAAEEGGPEGRRVVAGEGGGGGADGKGGAPLGIGNQRGESEQQCQRSEGTFHGIINVDGAKKLCRGEKDEKIFARVKKNA